MIALTLLLAATATSAPDAGTARILEGHSGAIGAVTFSPDGRWVASGGFDKTVRVWESATGNEVLKLEGPTAMVSALAFSADGKRLAVGDQGYKVRVWRMPQGTLECETVHPDAISSVAFSPDGAMLAVASNGNLGEVYAVPGCKEKFEFRGRTAQFSADGKTLLTANRLGSLLWFQLSPFKQLKELKTAAHLPYAVANADLSEVITRNGTEGPIHAWSASSGKELSGFVGHVKGVTSLSLSADGQTLASASEDGFVRLWNVKKREELRRFAVQGIVFAALSPDARWLAVAEGSKVKLYEVRP